MRCGLPVSLHLLMTPHLVRPLPNEELNPTGARRWRLARGAREPHLSDALVNSGALDSSRTCWFHGPLEMPIRYPAILVALFAPLLLACAAVSRGGTYGPEEAEQLRHIERKRLASLVEADVVTARRFHADDFELVNPAGGALSKDEYLAQIESGQVDYRAWEAGEITVRLYHDVAMIRYRDVRFDVDSRGQPVHRGPMFHTNVYERRAGQWQIVWSQASGQISPPRR